MAGPIAEAYVEILPQFGAFNSELKTELGKAQKLAESAGEGIEDSFSEAAKQSADQFNRLDKSAFNEVVTGSERAGEQVEDSFKEAARTSERALGGINFKKVAGGLAALFAGAQLGAFFKDATLQAQRLNSALANTDVIITATGGVAGVTADAIRSTSQELSLLTGVAAVDIQEASNILLTFKNIGAEAFERTQAAALDMTAVLGGDAKGAAVQLGKALNDPTVGVSALAKAGVTFTDQQKEQIKVLQESGDIIGAQNIVLAELEGQFKGAAAASADSTAKIGAAFTALKENVGQSLIGALDEVTPVLLEVITAITPALVLLGELLGDAFKALLPSITSLIKGLAPLFEILGKLIPIFAPIIELIAGIFVTAIETLAAAFGPVLDALAPVIDLIVGELGKALLDLAPIVSMIASVFANVLVQALEILVPIISELSPIFRTIAQFIAGTFARVVMQLADIFLIVVEAVAPLIPIIADGLMKAIRGLYPLVFTLVDAFTMIAPILVNALAPILPIIVDLFLLVVDAVLSLVPTVLLVIDTFQSIVLVLADALLPVLPVIAELFLGVVEALLPLLPVLMELVEALLPVLLEALNALVPLIPVLLELAQALLPLFIEIVDALLPLIELILDGLVWVLQEVLMPALDLLVIAFEFVIEVLVEVVNFLTNNLDPAIAATGDFFVKMGGFFQGVYNDVLLPIKNFFVGAFNTAIEAVGTAAGALGTAFEVAMGVIETVFNNVVMPIYNFYKDVFGTAFAAAGTAVETLGEVFSTVWGGITSTVETAVEAVKTAINFIIRGWNSIEFTLPKVSVPFVGDFGGQTIGTFKIDELANGGVVTGPTLALLGDNRSGREAVVPLERAGEFGFGNRNSAVVEIGVANFYDGTDADLVAQKTMLAMSARRLTA